jgi:hypothetical protein
VNGISEIGDVPIHFTELINRNTHAIWVLELYYSLRARFQERGKGVMACAHL